MQVNPHDHPEDFEHIDADAVCEACSNVNPPGTLLCKVCGNNLRDQRVRRMQAGGPAEVETPRFQVRRIISGVLAVVGLLAMILFAMKVDTIAGALMANTGSANETAEAFAPESYWTGADASHFEPLVDSMDANPLTIERASVQPPGAALVNFDGLYVLKRSNEETASVLGSGCVKKDGDKIYFAALLSGGTEIRGIGEMSSDSIIQAYHVAIRNADDTYVDGYGLARNEATGVLVCSGLYGDPETPVDLVAIQVPETLQSGTPVTGTTPSASEPAAAPASDATAPAAPAAAPAAGTQ